MAQMPVLPSGQDRIVPTNEFLEKLKSHGFDLDHIIPDGEIHRAHMNDSSAGSRPGWYVYYPDGMPAGAFGDWRHDWTENWCSSSINDLSPTQRWQYEANMARAQEARAKAREALRAESAAGAQAELEAAHPAHSTHPYLLSKRVRPYGIYQSGDTLLVPVRDIDGALMSTQRITLSGEKIFRKGGRTSGGMHTIGDIRSRILICEGYATGATLHEATGDGVVVAFNAGNLARVAQSVRKKYPSIPITVCADNDQWTDGNPGVTAGQKVVDALGASASLVYPEFEGVDTGSRPTDFNDLASLANLGVVARQLAGLAANEPVHDTRRTILDLQGLLDSEFSTDYVIDGYLVKHGVNQLFGESGHKKSFMALDMAMNIAAPGRPWHGKETEDGWVLYVVGEDVGGFKLRTSAWLEYHKINASDVPIFFRTQAVQLPAPEAMAMLHAELSTLTDQMGRPPALIVLDTKARCMDGHENDTKDANAWVAAVDSLIHEYMTTFLVVHHTGHMEKSRSRGAYAFLAALDAEYKVAKDAQGGITLSTVKAPKNDQAPDEIYFDTLQVPTQYRRKDGQVATSLVLASGGRPASPLSLNGGAADALAVLEDMYREARDNKAKAGHDPVNARVMTKDWRKRYLDKYYPEAGRETRKSAANRARDGLLTAGQVRIEGAFVYLAQGQEG